MRELIVNENDANQRVDKFLGKALNNLPKNLMYKYLRNKKIKVNHKRCEISQRLQVGDIVTCYISEEFFIDNINEVFKQAINDLKIVYEDNDIVIVDKPVGLLSQSDKLNDPDNVVDKLKKYLFFQGEYDPQQEASFAPAIANRLDRNTSGLIIGCKNAESLRIINRLIKERKISKHYLCIVANKLPSRGEFKDYYRRSDQQVTIQAQPFEGSKLVAIAYQCLDFHHNYSLADIDLLTGKTHQIRAQMAFHGYPLLGDKRYGGSELNNRFQQLCAYQLIFNHSDEDGLKQLVNKTIVLDDLAILKVFKTL